MKNTPNSSHPSLRIRTGPLAALVALVLVAAPAVSHASLVTDVADAADGTDPLDVNIDLRWRRVQRTARIVRENPGGSEPILELDIARYSQMLEAGLEIGLFHDLALRFHLPFAVEDKQSWQYSTVSGVSVEENSTLRRNRNDADGQEYTNLPAGEFRPIVGTVPGTVNRGGLLDPTIGLAWGPVNGDRDKSLPDDQFPFRPRVATSVIGVDYTLPLVDPMNPLSPSPIGNTSALPLGVGYHRVDFWLALSKRVGVVEPFFKVHYTLPLRSGREYDNCAAKTNGGDADNFVMSASANAKCDGTVAPERWRGKTGLIAPHTGGLLVGTEFIPVEEKDGLRFAIGVQASADYVSEGRTYTELSDLLGKLQYSDHYFKIDGRLTFDLRFSQYFHFTFATSIGHDTMHNLTAERTNGGYAVESGGTVETITIGSERWNPNYDFRNDQPGRRLGVQETAIFGLSATASINF